MFTTGVARQIPRSTLTAGLVLLLTAAVTPATAQVTSPHLIYATNDPPADTPRFRGWNDDPDNQGWTSEIQTTSASSGVNWVVSARSPFGNEALTVNLTTGPGIDVLRWDGTDWTVDWSAALTANTAHRGAAVAYEQTSGDALVVYFNGTSNPLFRVWDGTSWTAAASVFDQGLPAAPGTGAVDWVELASDPTSDRIALVYSDANNDVHAVIWNGNDWDETNTQITLTADGAVFRDIRDVAAAYDSAGNLVVVFARSRGFNDYRMAGGTTTWVSGGYHDMFNGSAAFIDLAAEPGGSRMAVVTVDQDFGIERIAGAVWTGAAWVNVGELDTTFPHWDSLGDGPFWASVAWLGQSGTAVIVASDEESPPPPAPGDSDMAWYTWTSGAGWTTQTDLTVPGISAANHIRSLQAESFQDQNTIMVAFSDDSGDLRAARYDGTSWTFSDVLNAGLPTAQYKPFALLGPATPDAYGYLKPVTVDRSRIPGGCGTTLTDFPMLYRVTDPDLAHTGSGGQVTDPQGDDIIFRGMDDATCGGAGLAPCQLDHEIESYDPATGALVAWVRIPSVNTASAASNTTIYIYYGNPTVTAPTENPTGVWDASYAAVYHLHDDLLDSTASANDGTPTGTSNASPAQVADGQGFNGTGDAIQTPSADLQAPDSFTISVWLKASDTAAPQHLLWEGVAPGNGWGAALVAPPPEPEMHLSIGDILPGTVGISPNYLSFFLGNTDAGTNGSPDVLSVRTPFSDTTGWHHVAVVASALSTLPRADLYFDGAFVMSDTGTTARTSRLGWDTDLRLGRPGANERYYNGAMDEVRLSTAARSSCEITAAFNNESDVASFYTVGLSVATAVELVSLEAVPGDGAIDLRWETGSEVDNLGFLVYRSLTPEGPWERLTANLIPGLGSSPEGARYGYRDLGLTNGVTYFYQLEDVETTGHTERHGPVWAAPLPRSEDASDPSDTLDLDEDAAAPEARAWMVYGEPEATSLRIVERGPQHVVVELETGGFYARADTDGSAWASIPGFEEADEPGTPALPVRLAWLEAMAGRQVHLASVVASEVEAFTGLRPGITGEPQLFEDEGGVLVTGRRERPAGAAFRGTGLYPEEAARVRSTAFQGDVKKAQLEMSPLRWDRSGGQLLLAHRLRVEVVFAGRERDELGLGGPRGRRPRQTRTHSPEGVVARLAIREAGLYAVAFEELFSGRGLPVSSLSLSRQGEPVAFHVEPAGTRFERGSVLYFASGGAALNPYGAEAVYELSLGQGGVVMPVADGAPRGRLVGHYWQTEERETNRLYQPTLLNTSDLWFWDYVPSGQTRGYPFTVDELAPATETARLRVWLHGGSDYAADPDHHLRVSLNGLPLGEASWNGKEPFVLVEDVPPGVLRDGENLLELENVGDTEAAYSLAILDRFSLSYPRRLATSKGQLHGWLDTGGTAVVDGLGPGSLVLDTTRDIPLWIVGAQPTGAGLSFRSEAGHRYLAVGPDSVRRPDVRPSPTSDLMDAGRRADYLVITPREFLPAVEPLLAHRRAQGLESQAVAIEDVFDAFGHGEGHPEALRSFLGHAYHTWEAPPRYVLLLGDATYAFKDEYGTGISNQVPPYMVKDAYMWTVSDPAYASVNGDDLLPDLALGRLPAQTLEQAETLVQKVLAWELGGFDLSGRAVLVADNADAAGDFEGEARHTAGLLPGREVEQILVSRLGRGARLAIGAAFDRGASLMSYFGHGSTAIWASENVFNVRDVPGLAAQDQQPFLFTMNCLNGYFHLPAGNNSLSEELLKAEGKGVVGAFSPSSLSVHWAAALYHRALVEELASGRHQRLGDAVLAAQEAYVGLGARAELLAVYQLLADPALKLK
ncbi:MAG: DUF2341 domain-containing protein [Acidobacteria bacterium]|nr:DUF2341 domain-containing protein [Acidobacteriota bacterium]